MPPKKKARGKARRAAKSRKVKEDDGAVNGIDSEMQRLQIGNNKNSIKDDDEEALLEEAINLAATEKKELESAAKNDEINNSKKCYHGYILLPRNHVCVAFIESFVDVYRACCMGNLPIGDLFEHIYEATKTKHAEVWNDPDKVKWVASHFIKLGVDMILEGSAYQAVGRSAIFSSFLELWAAEVICQNKTEANWNIFVALCDWTKMSELYYGDEHTLVSFFRKRITCKCLDDKYEEVKSIAKIGFCCNPNCSIPDRKTARSKMLYCTQCRKANYCSRECQVANWPIHKQICAIAANMLAARKSRQKKVDNLLSMCCITNED